MTIKQQRASKVYRHPKTGEEIHKLGYAMETFLYVLSNLEPGEPIPVGIISPTGEGDVPGQRNHLAGDAWLNNYVDRLEVEKIAKKYRDIYHAEPDRVPLKLTPFGKRAVKHNEIVGIEPPIAISIMHRRVDRAIAKQRAEGYAGSNGERQRKTA